MIRVGIIGAGPNGAGHARALSELKPRCRVVFVADLDSARAEQEAGPCGARGVANFADALGDVDAVVISSPNFLHVDHAITAAQAGKHVWIEKPMALTHGGCRPDCGGLRARAAPGRLHRLAHGRTRQEVGPRGFPDSVG